MYIMINPVAKFMKIKYPLVAAIFVTLGYDYVMHYYTEAPQGHWITTHSTLIIYQFSIH
jgi:hypothetical protein